MNASQLWPNVIAYALQVGLLVGLGALGPTLLRLRTPQARLLYWQALLAACVVLPWVQPWRQEVISLSNASLVETVSLASAGSAQVQGSAAGFVTAHRAIEFPAIVLWLLLAGFVARVVSLAARLVRLAGYRQRGRELDSDPVFKMATPGAARWLISDEVAGPVTFGWRDPVVMLPARFPLLRTELREAILCHELIHIERRDWMFTVAEELVRAVFWFHPAIWWVLGEIQLAREQTVDLAVIEITHAKESYVDALLAMAGAPDAAAGSLELAPAPLFLRKRHLKQRVMGLLREVRVSPNSGLRSIFAGTGAAVIIAAACWLSSGIFPLSAAPQFVADAEGVTVRTGDAKLIRRTSVEYPFEALEKGVQGEVIIQAKVEADGTLSDKTQVACPAELCAAAMDSLPYWQFDRRQAGTTREIRIDFVRPVEPAVQPAIDLSPDPRLARVVELTQSFRPIAPGLMAATIVSQAPRIPAQTPAFEVAAIRLNRAPGPQMGITPSLNHGVLHGQYVTLRTLLEVAYGMAQPQIIGPDWLDKNRFDIAAKSPAGTPDSELKPMMQTLLKERFSLKAHTETREMPVYFLDVAKDGVKMAVYPEPERPLVDPRDRCFASMRGTATTSQIATGLGRFTGNPVVDKTGLTERYSYFLCFAPLSPVTGDNASEFGAPDLFTALQKQAGLKLEPGKASLDVVVVDHMERMPTEN